MIDSFKTYREQVSVTIGGFKIVVHYSGTDHLLKDNLMFFQKFYRIFIQDACRSSLSFTVIHLYYVADCEEYRQWFMSEVSEIRPIIPNVIEHFYQTLGKNGISFLPPEQHCNKYYRKGTRYYLDFPYQSDLFYCVLDIGSKEMYLFGKKQNIIRVFFDLMSIELPVFPFHGSAVAQNGNALCFMGNSQTGKSSIRKLLIGHGYEPMADDMILLKENTLYPFDTLINVSPYTAEKDWKTAIIQKVYILHRYDPETNRYIPYLQWFPVVAKQSVFWHLFLENDRVRHSLIEAKVEDSVRQIKIIISDAEHITIDPDKVNVSGIPSNYQLDDVIHVL